MANSRRLAGQASVILAVVLGFLCGSLYGGTGDSLVNENFDELTPQEGVTLVGAFHTINGTNVDIVQNGGIFGYLCQSPESGNCIDMNGGYAWGDPQGHLQSNMLFPSGNYLLSFDLIGSQRDATASVMVTFGDYSQVFTLTSTDDVDGIVVNQPVTLTTPGYLEFASETEGQIGLLLDNVVVSAQTVPEPSSLLLLGSALWLAGSRFRRQ